MGPPEDRIPVVPFFLVTLVVLLTLKNRQLNKQMREQVRAFREKHPELLEKVEALEVENQALKDKLNKMTDHLSKSTERLKEERREKEERPVREWQEWLKGLTELSYQNEIEVEVKFILPLVKYLGYRESDFQLRATFHVQAGREKKRVQADWVLWDRSKHPPKARAVIEAKAPTEDLDDEDTREQTRSYAVALRAPVYAIINGQRLKVFRCEIQGDTLIVDCGVRRLGEVWPRIHQEMGVGPGIHGIV